MRKFIFQTFMTIGLMALRRDRREAYLEAMGLGFDAYEEKHKECGK